MVKYMDGLVRNMPFTPRDRQLTVVIIAAQQTSHTRSHRSYVFIVTFISSHTHSKQHVTFHTHHSLANRQRDLNLHSSGAGNCRQLNLNLLLLINPKFMHRSISHSKPKKRRKSCKCHGFRIRIALIIGQQNANAATKNATRKRGLLGALFHINFYKDRSRSSLLRRKKTLNGPGKQTLDCSCW